MGTAVAQWLRCCATNRKVPGSIPDGVFEIFYCLNLSDRTKAVGSTLPRTEMGFQWPRGFQQVKIPRFHANGTGMW